MQVVRRRLLKPRTRLRRERRMEISGLNDEHEELRNCNEYGMESLASGVGMDTELANRR